MKTNLQNNAKNFLFHYQMRSDSMWLTNGTNVHVLFCDGSPTMKNGRYTDVAIGFVNLGNGVMRVLKGCFAVSPMYAGWQDFEVKDMPIGEAREMYAAFRDTHASWRGTIPA